MSWEIWKYSGFVPINQHTISVGIVILLALYLIVDAWSAGKE
jgi:hypothetical protein